ncbi:transglycosylase domain-containing protein [Leptothoe kymatousa]|uniref:PBP1A family penicillin-binding protein n=1 Tax=Leptothoe kymatousa TAU-MAC 1615 TaxID=2364775 RepID=A0ABS5Y7J3_9CYAN|nr:PBP1A family penicillin-binding protein [Leptothoe kymatousa]MBT9313746.1 PBP1A family penicillin-binding protein [Leptothoe kymatousa TAU-MAC 1615]
MANWIGKIKNDGADKRLTAAIAELKQQKTPKPLYRSILFWLTLLVGAGIAGSATRGYRFWQEANANLPDVSNALTFERTGTITIKADDGSVLQKIGPATQEYLEYDDIPDTLVQGFIASEDRRFYDHGGIDYKGIARAVYSNVRNRDLVEGASTITQQVARIIFLDQDRSFQRKFREALLAQKLEKELGKEKILERYLNLVYLGAGAYGVADAAWIYFGKAVEELTVAEIALIAGMAPAPSVYSPLVDEDAAREQRDKVVSRMLENGVISQAQATTAYRSDVATTPNEPKFLYSEFPYFTIYVQKKLPELISQDAIEAGGLIVETSLEPKWQRSAETTLEEVLEEYGRWQRFEQGSIVALNPKTGQIHAMVGGTDFEESQFNRVTQAQRQPGSTFKAFVYSAAIASGLSPYKGYVDARYVVDGYEPKNYGGKFSGNVELRRALSSSINIVAVKVLVEVGFEPVIELAKRMGIKSDLLPAYSLALGSSEVNLLEITNAYGAIAAEGKHVDAHGITRITNRSGKVLYEFSDEPEQAIDQDSAAIMAWMMRSVVEGGTGSNAYISGRQIAGKTGTSEKNRDLWFIGFTPDLVVGVWFGNDDSSPTRGASSTAAYAWRKFVEQFIEDLPVEKFPELPRLSGREGSIEAKPVKPGKVIAEKAGSSRRSSDSAPRQSAPEPAPQPRRAEEPAPQPRADPAPRRSTPPPVRQEPVTPAPAPTPTSPAPAPIPAEPAPEPIFADPPAPAAPSEPVAPAPPVAAPAPIEPAPVFEPAPAPPAPAPAPPAPIAPAPAPAAPAPVDADVSAE